MFSIKLLVSCEDCKVQMESTICFDILVGKDRLLIELGLYI